MKQGRHIEKNEGMKAVLDKVVWKSILIMKTFYHPLERMGGTNHKDVWGHSIPNGRNCQCKGPEARMCLTYSRH